MKGGPMLRIEIKGCIFARSGKVHISFSINLMSALKKMDLEQVLFGFGEDPSYCICMLSFTFLVSRTLYVYHSSLALPSQHIDWNNSCSRLKEPLTCKRPSGQMSFSGASQLTYLTCTVIVHLRLSDKVFRLGIYS